MKKETRYYVTFYSPGSFLAETSERELAHATEPQAIVWPANAYAFTLSQQETILDHDSWFHGKMQRTGPMYYHPDSKVETLEQARRNPRATGMLISNMECNGWEKIVWSRWGTWPQHFDPTQCEVLP